MEAAFRHSKQTTSHQAYQILWRRQRELFEFPRGVRGRSAVLASILALPFSLRIWSRQGERLCNQPCSYYEYFRNADCSGPKMARTSNFGFLFDRHYQASSLETIGMVIGCSFCLLFRCGIGMSITHIPNHFINGIPILDQR